MDAKTINRRPGLRAAIDGKCKDCIYDPLDTGTWREQVGRCTCLGCPLWPIRPMPRYGRTKQARPGTNAIGRADPSKPDGDAVKAARTVNSGYPGGAA